MQCFLFYLEILLYLNWCSAKFYSSFFYTRNYWLIKIPLDMMTITIAAITIGIAVDNSIHYIYRFKEEFKKLMIIKKH